MNRWLSIICILLTTDVSLNPVLGNDARGTEFFESKIRPLLVKRCYECHSEKAGEQQGGLLLDRRSGWLEGGDTSEAVLPGEPEESLLIEAVQYSNDKLQMPPDGKLEASEIQLLVSWVRMGAPGPQDDVGETEFSLLGNQDYLFKKAKTHWAFQSIAKPDLPTVNFPGWNNHPVDQLVAAELQANDLKPSRSADARTLIRRLSYDLTGLPPTMQTVRQFVQAFQNNRESAIASAVERLVSSQQFGEHIARLWLDVARYGDTDGAYRPDTKTPHYYPFAFTYRDYVIDAFNKDKPVDDFIREQLAADLYGFKKGSPELAALGFLAAGPHANRNQSESVDDWIDVTTRGLMGLTAACARCHDHKYEPIPTADYYSLHGIFSSVTRIHPLDETRQPLIGGSTPSAADLADYGKKRAAIDKKIENAGNSKAKNNNRSIATKIRETELAQLLQFHPGGPARAMIVIEKKRPVDPVIFVRGQASSRGAAVPRRFLRILDPTQESFPDNSSGRKALAEKIVSPSNPLTARVFVNRIWGYLMGSHLVATPSDFGLQGAAPTHPELLDWLAYDFMSNRWSLKRLVRQIVLSRTYQQTSQQRQDLAAIDPLNKQLWRANCKRLSIEAIRDSILAVSGQLDLTPRGRPGLMWEEDYTRRRAIYGFINRFNLDPTLRAFDFPAPMQTQPARSESIVATQALFSMNAQFVIDQAWELTKLERFKKQTTDAGRIDVVFTEILQRKPTIIETERFLRFAELQARHMKTKKTDDKAATWPLAAQALMMSNEFQYLD